VSIDRTGWYKPKDTRLFHRFKNGVSLCDAWKITRPLRPMTRADKTTALTAMTGDRDAWKIRHDAKEQMRLEDEATIKNLQRRLDEAQAPVSLDEWLHAYHVQGSVGYYMDMENVSELIAARKARA